MYFNRRKRYGLNHIVDGNAVLRIPGGIDNGAIHIVDVLLERVYNRAFAIGLEEDHVHSQFVCKFLHPLVDVV
jgi:hypothetical protein